MSGYLAERSGWHLSFQVAAVVMTLGAVPILMFRSEDGSRETEERVSMSTIFRREYLSVILLFFAFALVLSTGQSVVGTMLPIFLKNQRTCHSPA